jgi:hypothetical protein
MTRIVSNQQKESKISERQLKILLQIQKLKNLNYFRQLLKKIYRLLIGTTSLRIKCLGD